MRASSVHGLIAGAFAERPCAEVPELAAIGEETAPRRRPMGWHQHDTWELYVQISGSSTRAWRQGVVAMEAGQAFLAAPQAPHRVVNRGSAAQHYAYVRFALEPVCVRHPGLAEPWRASGCTHLLEGGTLREPLERLLREVATDQPLAALGVRLALDALVIAIARLLTGVTPRVLPPVPPAIERARRLLEERCEERWSLARLAAEAGVSGSQLRALFRRHLGQPPHRFQNARRIARAQHLLAYTDLSIGHVAAQLGFATSQHFACCFRAHAGACARVFRQRALRAAMVRADEPMEHARDSFQIIAEDQPRKPT